MADYYESKYKISRYFVIWYKYSGRGMSLNYYRYATLNSLQSCLLMKKHLVRLLIPVGVALLLTGCGAKPDETPPLQEQQVQQPSQPSVQDAKEPEQPEEDIVKILNQIESLTMPDLELDTSDLNVDTIKEE